MDQWVQLATAAFKRTPKTPLSFFCGLAWIVGGIVFGALYSNISIAQKEFAVGFALIFLAAEFVLILAHPREQCCSVRRGNVEKGL